MHLRVHRHTKPDIEMVESKSEREWFVSQSQALGTHQWARWEQSILLGTVWVFP